MKTDHLSKESILAVQKMRTQIPALGYVVTPEDAVKMAEIIDAEMAHGEKENVSDQATASAGHSKDDRQLSSRCLHPICSPLVLPTASE